MNIVGNSKKGYELVGTGWKMIWKCMKRVGNSRKGCDEVMKGLERGRKV